MPLLVSLAFVFLQGCTADEAPAAPLAVADLPPCSYTLAGKFELEDCVFRLSDPFKTDWLPCIENETIQIAVNQVQERVSMRSEVFDFCVGGASFFSKDCSAIILEVYHSPHEIEFWIQEGFFDCLEGESFYFTMPITITN